MWLEASREAGVAVCVDSYKHDLPAGLVEIGRQAAATTQQTTKKRKRKRKRDEDETYDARKVPGSISFGCCCSCHDEGKPFCEWCVSAHQDIPQNTATDSADQCPKLIAPPISVTTTEAEADAGADAGAEAEVEAGVETKMPPPRASGWPAVFARCESKVEEDIGTVAGHYAVPGDDFDATRVAALALAYACPPCSAPVSKESAMEARCLKRHATTPTAAEPHGDATCQEGQAVTASGTCSSLQIHAGRLVLRGVHCRGRRRSRRKFSSSRELRRATLSHYLLHQL